MDPSLPSLLLLLTLVTPGSSVTCFECYSTSELSCSGPTTECSSGFCMSGLIAFNDYRLFGRGCAPSNSSCGVSGSMTSSTEKALLSTSCCKENKCTPANLSLPQTSAIKNRVTCPCASGANCKEMECQGYERQCAKVDFTTVGVGLGLRFQGCATDSICMFENQTFDINGTVYRLGIACKGSPSVHSQQCFMFLTLALAVSLLIKHMV